MQYTNPLDQSLRSAAEIAEQYECLKTEYKSILDQKNAIQRQMGLLTDEVISLRARNVVLTGALENANDRNKILLERIRSKTF